MPTQRNLLFGALATHLDFISVDQFVAGMDVWVRDKSRNLGEILVNAGALDRSSRDVLEQLVEKHLALHSNQTDRSLAAMTLVDSTRDRLLKVADPELRVAIEQLTVATIDGGNLMRTLTLRPHAVATQTQVPEPVSPATILLSSDESAAAPSVGNASSARFRILRPHAKGGLGEVFVAEDKELHREVALKEIQLRHARRADSRSRFMLEAEVTGSLEHPGIVPVYALGQYADGRPYYAMRFIHGESFHDAIDKFYGQRDVQADPAARALGLRQLLRRFVDVCNAIDYAHSRGVLHRDLKPANVMLGNYGETLVVDWGLAKTLGRDDVEANLERQLHPLASGARTGTLMGVAIGTPSYMSPEQAAGKLDQLGPAADVYSLGATLYTVLTGQPSITDADVQTVLNRVKQGKFPPPRQVLPACPKPLEAICLRAMALAPADRYATARELADDIEHYLADEATEAYHEPWSERLLRWARKHKSWTQAIAAALLIVTVIATLASMLINQSRHQESLARADAEDNFQQARRTVDDFFTRVSENKLLNVPGLQPLRKDLLQAALGYYTGFIAQRKNDPKLQRELAETYYRVGLIAGELGDHKQGAASLQNAFDIQQRLVKQGGTDTDNVNFALSNTVNALGDSNLRRGSPDSARRWFQQALEIRQQLVTRQPTDVAWARKLANSHNNVGIALLKLGRTSEAEEQFGEANRRRALLVAEWPKQPQLLRDLAQGYFNLAHFKQDLGDYASAAAGYQQAIEAYERLIVLDAKPIDYQRELATTLRVAGDLRERLGQNEAAAEHFERSLAIAGSLARQNPFLLELQADVASTQVGLGRLEQKTADPERAAELFAAARTIRQQLVAADPEVQRYKLDLAQCQSLLGELQLDRDQLDEAEQSFAGALAMYNALAQEQPDDDNVADAQAQTLRNAALVERARGNHAAALEKFSQGRAIYERLANKKPQDLAIQMGLADALINIVVEQRALKQPAEATATAAQALSLQEAVARQHPDVALYQYVYAEALYTVGLVALEQDQPAPAAEKFAAAAEVVRKLVAAHPENLKYVFMLGSALDKLSVCLWKQDQRDEAQAKAAEAGQWAQQAFDAAPAAIDYRLSLGDSLFNRALFARELGQLDVAVELAEQRRTLWPDDAARLYSVAVELAQVAAAAMGAERDRIARRAIDAVQAALVVSAQQVPPLADDKRLEVLRAYSAFQSLIKAQADTSY